DVTMLPRPVQRPRIPVWCGGRWPNKAPFRRAARWDGGMPTHAGYALGQTMPPDELRAGIGDTLGPPGTGGAVRRGAGGGTRGPRAGWRRAPRVPVGGGGADRGDGGAGWGGGPPGGCPGPGPSGPAGAARALTARAGRL